MAVEYVERLPINPVQTVPDFTVGKVFQMRAKGSAPGLKYFFSRVTGDTADQ